MRTPVRGLTAAIDEEVSKAQLAGTVHRPVRVLLGIGGTILLCTPHVEERTVEHTHMVVATLVMVCRDPTMSHDKGRRTANSGATGLRTTGMRIESIGK